MARVNVEDQWWTDERRFLLAERVGGKHIADGIVLNAWKLSQDYWARGRRKIPYFVFIELFGAELLLEFDLAKKIGANVYVRGSRQFHEWIASRIDQASKGGKSIRKESKQTGSKREANVEPLISSTSSISISNTKNIYIPPTSEKQGTLGTGELGSAIEEWGKTLRHYSIAKDPRSDEQPIARMVQRFGLENSVLALRGIRHEAKTRDFDPAKFCHIRRVADPKNFDRFVNLGAQAVGQDRKRFNTSEALSDHTPEPERIPGEAKKIADRIRRPNG